MLSPDNYKENFEEYRIKMKKKSFYTIAFGLLLSAFLTVNAQEIKESKRAQNAESTNAVQPPIDRLSLKKEQQVPYREIIKRYAMQVRDLRKSSLSKEEKNAKMKEIDINRDVEIKNVLSEQQFKIYQEIKEEQKTKYLDLRKK